MLCRRYPAPVAYPHPCHCGGGGRVAVRILLAFGLTLAGTVSGETIRKPPPLDKHERVGAWQPADGGVQIPLWPKDIVLAKPDSGDRPEATGNGTGLVGGRLWHWASYVTRPTMTVYRPKGRNSGAAILVLPGGGFEVVATDLEGTEICGWAARQGMTCAMLKYRVPQARGWPSTAAEASPGAGGRAACDGIAARAGGDLWHRSTPDRRDRLFGGAYLVANLSNTTERTYPAADAADRLSSRPDFAIIAYTARMLDDSKGRNSLELRPG